LETKKLRLREMKSQFENVCEENATLKLKLAEIERKSVGGLRDERELLEIIRHLEEEVSIKHSKSIKFYNSNFKYCKSINLLNSNFKNSNYFFKYNFLYYYC
jgi:hypothetical protein